LDLSYPGKSECCKIQNEASRNSNNPSHVPHFTVEKGCWCLGGYSVEAELPEGLEVYIDDLEVGYGRF
jgi:hypothetical protein